MTDVDRAATLGHDLFAGLPPRQRHQYGLLWEAALGEGFQESGLLLLCLSALSHVLGHTSPIVPKRFGRFCADQRLWCRVPGKLYPHPRWGAPGQRARSYLVLAPSGDPGQA